MYKKIIIGIIAMYGFLIFLLKNLSNYPDPLGLGPFFLDLAIFLFAFITAVVITMLIFRLWRKDEEQDEEQDDEVTEHRKK